MMNPDTTPRPTKEKVEIREKILQRTWRRKPKKFNRDRRASGLFIQDIDTKDTREES